MLGFISWWSIVEGQKHVAEHYPTGRFARTVPRVAVLLAAARRTRGLAA